MNYVEEYYKKKRVNRKLEKIFLSLLITGLSLLFIGIILTLNISLEQVGNWTAIFGVILIGISLIININAVQLLKRTYEVVEEE